MCLLFLQLGTNDSPTIIANNRDEYYTRATARGVFSTHRHHHHHRKHEPQQSSSSSHSHHPQPRKAPPASCHRHHSHDNDGEGSDEGGEGDGDRLVEIIERVEGDLPSSPLGKKLGSVTGEKKEEEEEEDDKEEEEEGIEDDYYCSYSPKDLQSGGSWLEFDRIAHPQHELKFAIVLNFHHWREFSLFSYLTGQSSPLAGMSSSHLNKLISRGKLVSNFMRSEEAPPISAKAYAEKIWSTRFQYRPFNLIISDSPLETYYISSSIKQEKIRKLLPGHLYGISNGYLDDHWEKIIYGKEMIEKLIHETLTKVNFQEIQNEKLGILLQQQQQQQQQQEQEGEGAKDGMTSYKTNSLTTSSSSSGNNSGLSSAKTTPWPSNLSSASTASSMSYTNDISKALDPPLPPPPEILHMPTPAEFSLSTPDYSQQSQLGNQHFSPPIPAINPFSLPRIQEIIDYEGHHYTHYRNINQFLEGLMTIMMNSDPLPDYTFPNASLPMMQLASIFVTPTIIVKDEKLSLWSRLMGNKLKLIPKDIHQEYETIDTSMIDKTEVFGTRTITIFVYFDGLHFKKQYQQQQKQSNSSMGNLKGRSSHEEGGESTGKSLIVTEQEGSNLTKSKISKNLALFGLIESDFILNEENNYQLVKSTNVFTNL